MLRLASVLLALAAAIVTGLLAAYKWYSASTVKIELGCIYPGSQTYRRWGTERPVHEPVDPELRQVAQHMMNEAAKRNKAAALWTVASIVLFAITGAIALD